MPVQGVNGGGGPPDIGDVVRQGQVRCTQRPSFFAMLSKLSR
jgi:hypothetical protein